VEERDGNGIGRDSGASFVMFVMHRKIAALIGFFRHA
jgi:hypothetical protein